MKYINVLIGVFVFGILMNPIGVIAQGGSKQPPNVIKFDKVSFDAEVKNNSTGM